MGLNLVSSLKNFFKEEKINMVLREVTNSEFWLEDPYGFLVVKFLVDEDAHSILYDVFSPKYDVHLKEETLKDAKRLDSIVEERGKWDYEKSIEDLWLILDSVKLWTKENGFNIKEKSLI